MKLIKRTYLYTLIWLLPIMIIGSLFAFYMIEYIAYEETDEFLTYEMQRLINYHEINNDLPDFHKVADIITGVKYNEPVFKDTLLLEPGDNEMVPHRELRFSIDHNGQDFTIVIRHLLLGRDDIAQGTLLIISGLIFLFLIFIVLTINMVSGRIWAPFYKTLNKITGFRISDPIPLFEKSGIDEFNILNSSLQGLLKKISDDYRHNKEFNENASHELQTHLAVIKANAAKLMDEKEAEQEGMEEMNRIYSAATKLSQVQKSLLLLSKISNREFTHNEVLDFAAVLKSSVETFSEASELLGIKISLEIENCTLLLDPGLAEVLVNNLVKNAVKHNIPEGSIFIRLTSEQLIIENTGHNYKGDPEKLLQRFSKGEKGNIGIGLAIVKEICGIYNFNLTYTITEENLHRIRILFKK